MFYWTSYYLPTNDQPKAKFASYIIASDEEEAKKIIKLRGMREKIGGYTLKIHHKNRVPETAPLYKKRDLLICMHTLCFVGNALIHAKLLKSKDLLADNGLIHDILHEYMYPEDYLGWSNVRYTQLKEFDNLAKKLGF